MTGPERVEWVPGQQPLPAPDWCSWCGDLDIDHQDGPCAGFHLDADGLYVACDCDHWVPDDGPVPQPVTAVALEEYL